MWLTCSASVSPSLLMDHRGAGGRAIFQTWLRRWESESSIWHSAENQVFRAWERRAYVPREETSPFPGSWQPSRSAVVFCVLEAQQ